MNCAIEDKKNFGRSRCNTLPNLPNGMITTDDDVVIPKATLASQSLLLAFLNTKILEGKAWYWPNFSLFENISQEAGYEDTPLAYLLITDGNYRFRFGISENICFHKAAYSHRAISGRVILIDKLNQLLLTETSTGDGKGLGIQLLTTEKFVFNDGAGVATKTPIVVALRNNKEIDKSGIIVTLDAYDELYRIVDVALEIISATATEIVVTAKAECDGTSVLGLVTADFIVKDEDGNANGTITAVEDGEGQYTLTGTGIEDGTLDLRPPATLGVKAYKAIVETFAITT
jgi:hypothetical protein